MSAAEQTFHYAQELKPRVNTDAEQSELLNLQEKMIVADRMGSLVSNSYGSFGLKTATMK